LPLSGAGETRAKRAKGADSQSVHDPHPLRVSADRIHIRGPGDAGSGDIGVGLR